MGAIRSLPEDKVKEKLEIAQHWVRMGFPLALTRANGSDTYTNTRAAIYGRRMERHHDVHEEAGTSECGIFFDEFIVKMQVFSVFLSFYFFHGLLPSRGIGNFLGSFRDSIISATRTLFIRRCPPLSAVIRRLGKS